MRRTVAAMVAAASMLAACGSSEQPAAATPSPSPSAAASASASAPATPPLTFTLKDVTGGKATGKILLTKGAGFFVVELQITGLETSSSHVSHIHVGSCQNPGGIKFALSQVIADGTGAADTRTQIPTSFPPAGTRWYVVVHAGGTMQGSSASYLLCGNLF